MMLQTKYNSQLIQCILGLVWAQWNRLGLIGSVGTNKYSTDIEAAILIFAHAVQWDGRLYDGVWGWLGRYENIVNGERLTTLIRDENSEWVARFLGAFFEKTVSTRWKGVIKQCKKVIEEHEKMQSPPWDNTPLAITSPTKEWVDKDPTFLKWGILCHQMLPREKLQDHAHILQANTHLRYRYLYGSIVRADVIYLLSVSDKCKIKKESDFLHSARLAYQIHCNPSTIHYIQKDFEEGGLLYSNNDLAQNSHMMTWKIRDYTFFKADPDYDCGIIYWVDVNSILKAALELVLDLQKLQNDTIRKSRIVAFQDAYFPVLDDHECPVLAPYGSTLTPLENYTVEQLTMMIIERLQLFYNIVCKIFMIRCQKCKNIFSSPLQGRMSSFATNTLIDNQVQCPQCTATFSTRKRDFFYYNAFGNAELIAF